MTEAYESGRAPDWLTAAWLGENGASAGYATVRSILMRGAPASVDYAGVAMAQIAGLGAEDELLEILETAEERPTRRGAAYGLHTLATERGLAAVFNAGRQRRIHLRDAAYIVSRHPIDPDIVLPLLSSEDRRLRLFGLTIVAGIDEAERRVFREATRAALLAVGVWSDHHARETLRRWLGESDDP